MTNSCDHISAAPSRESRSAAGRVIWDGRGEIAAGAAYFTKDDGQLVGRPYVRERARRHIARWGKYPSLGSVEQRRAALAHTVDDDEWLGARNGMLVAAICRDVEAALLQGGTGDTWGKW